MARLKTELLTTRCTPQFKSAVEKAAKQDGRTTSSLVHLLLSQYLIEKGLLDADEKPITKPAKRKR